jgi:hypothetical protein
MRMPARLAGHLLKSVGRDKAWEILEACNESQNSPKIEEIELRRTFDSVLKIEAANHIKIASLLYTPSQVISEYVGNCARISFGGKSLSAMEAKMNSGLVGGGLYLLGGIPSILGVNNSRTTRYNKK